ncbi:MAG: glycosyltransferase family 9 protein, partial [Vicinamibacterales bacterium]
MRILVVRLREIGDVVFTTPALTALRARFPKAFIAYLVEPPAAPVVAGNPSIDELIVAPHRTGRLTLARLRAEVRLIRELRARRFDLILDFHGGPRASIVSWLSGAPRRVGYRVAGRSWMYTTAVDRPRELRPRHSVENQWDLLTALGFDRPDPRLVPVVMTLDAVAAQQVDVRLTGAAVTSAERVVVIHVSAGNPFRRWSIAAFARLAAQLASDDPRHRIVVTSGPSERHASASVIEAARASLPPAVAGQVLDCGDFSLAELRALVERAILYIGGDSGPMHIAATSRVPMVSLYGPTLPARSAPWRDPQWRAEAVQVEGLPCRPCDQRACAPGDFRCLSRMTPDDVVAAARRALGATPAAATEATPARTSDG